uniref:Uncharacterized protein n=1 Tax=Panagrolaimus sp. ES5 TaxID=591445 RepID=A0AC34F2B5_9BILA
MGHRNHGGRIRPLNDSTYKIYKKKDHQNGKIQSNKKVKKAQLYSFKASSLFLQLKNDIFTPSFSSLNLDEICKNLLIRDETVLTLTICALYGLNEAYPQVFKDAFHDRIMPLIGELFTWEEHVGDQYIFTLNKLFNAVFDLPVITIFGLYDELCGYVLKGLKNKQNKMKVFTLHILQTHLFSRCPATMNENIYYKYLNFISEECAIGKVHIDVMRAGLHTLPDFLDIYLRDNDPSPDENVILEIHDNELQIVSRDPEIDNDYTFGGTVFYDIPQWYPTNNKNGIAVLGLCCFKFLSRIVAIEDFPLQDHFKYMATALELINQILKRYVTDHNIKQGRYGNAFINLTKNLGFMVIASHNRLLSPLLRELHDI